MVLHPLNSGFYFYYRPSAPSALFHQAPALAPGLLFTPPVLRLAFLRLCVSLTIG